MNRQIIITLNNMDYMMNVDVERTPSAAVYHVQAHQHLRKQLPEAFDITIPDNTGKPEYDEALFSPEGRQIVHIIGEQLSRLPPQLKNNNGGSRI